MSDIHAYDGDGSSSGPSFVRVTERTDLSLSQPVSALFSLLEDGELDDCIPIDVLICPGDLGDKAQPEGIRYGWMVLNEIARRMQAKLLACTVGNHDVNSRSTSSDPEEVLKSLVPPFPSRSYSDAESYWSDGYIVHESVDYRLILVNSSWRHGKIPDEYKFGRITPEVRTAILSRIKDKDFPINILVCHHHPHKHSELDLGEYDEMVGGQELIKEIAEQSAARWLFIHGHKHHPKIVYASGPSNAPIVFSAGSFGAKLYPELATVCRNQFYVLDLESSELDGNKLQGRFRAWEYSKANGWVPATVAAGLPAEGGFGNQIESRTLAEQIKASITSSFHTADDIAKAVPRIAYVLPEDLKQVVSELRRIHVKVIVDEFGKIAQVGL